MRISNASSFNPYLSEESRMLCSDATVHQKAVRCPSEAFKWTDMLFYASIKWSFMFSINVLAFVTSGLFAGVVLTETISW